MEFSLQSWGSSHWRGNAPCRRSHPLADKIAFCETLAT